MSRSCMGTMEMRGCGIRGRGGTPSPVEADQEFEGRSFLFVALVLSGVVGC